MRKRTPQQELMEIKYVENGLTAEQYVALMKSCGRQRTELQSEMALKGGLYNVLAKDGEQAVGMGRLIGDGVMYWYIQDVMIRPEYQGKGIGKTIIEYLLRHVESNGVSGTSAYVGLMSAKGKDGFYEKLGFIARPNEKYGAGMDRWIEIK